MTRLIELLGKSLRSREAIEELARYPTLQRELDDAAVDEGLPPVHYLRSEAEGLLIKLSDEEEIVAIFMMSEGKDGFSQFRGQLPGQLPFSATPADALKRLGAPGYSKPPGRVSSYEHGALLRFDRPTHSVHFQFRKDGGIDLVTAMVASAVPGRNQGPQLDA